MEGNRYSFCASRISFLSMSLSLYQGFVHIGAAIAEELPGFADFADHVQVQVCGENFVLVAGRLRDDLAARITEVAGAVELADVPRSLHPDPVDGADIIAVGYGVRRLLQLAQ